MTRTIRDRRREMMLYVQRWWYEGNITGRMYPKHQVEMCGETARSIYQGTLCAFKWLIEISLKHLLLHIWSFNAFVIHRSCIFIQKCVCCTAESCVHIFPEKNLKFTLVAHKTIPGLWML